MGMKNSMKIAAVSMAMLCALTGISQAQVAQKKTTGVKSATSTKEVVGVKTTTAVDPVTAQGYAVDATQAQQKSSGELANTFEGRYLDPGQGAFKLARNRVLDYTNESKKSELKVSMTEEYNYLRIRILSTIFNGGTKLEICNPKGEVVGSYTVKADDEVVLGEQTKTSESVQGELTKSFRFPIKGDWIIRAMPTAATGNVLIEIYQEFYPNLDRIDPENERKSSASR
jgi:hypothetical protein